jgi:Icc-related predicted phosphoesterase
MIRRLRVPWPAARTGDTDGIRPFRILAVSDERDDALVLEVNREAIGTIDAIVGAGDLEPEYLSLLADAFHVPLFYVLGNHDRGAGWQEHADHLPDPMLDGRVEHLHGLDVVGLSWPGNHRGRAVRDDGAAWLQALRAYLRHLLRRRPLLMISHVPPEGCGDDPTDPYHAGFAAYRWLARRTHPPLWLHGHTTVATQKTLVSEVDSTHLVNVTGAVLLELDSRLEEWPALN